VIMSSLIRKTVSKKKRRYQKQGFDLDLSYITDKLIAMGFPSESVEGVYRNPFKEVFRFLELMHKDHYKVYNLCSERSYDISKFHNRVECFPFDDHNCPTIDQVLKFCENVKHWIKSNDKNVAVIHCKAGKGRTGLMICCYMIFSQEWSNPKDALDFYAAMRTFNKKGVTIPSQIRYVYYTGHIMNQWGGILPKSKALLLKSIIFHTIPKVLHPTEIKFSVYVFKTLVFSYKDTPKLQGQKKKGEKKKEEDETLNFEIPNLPLCGDIKFDFYERETFGSERLLCFWINTLFVGSNNILEIKKDELDKAAKDKNCKIFSRNFKVEMVFEELEDKSDIKITTINQITENKIVAPIIDKDKELTSTDEEDEIGLPEDDSNQTRDPYPVSEMLLKQLIEIRLSQENCSSVDLRKTNNFKIFDQSLCDLQEISLDKLLTPQEKLAFWINVFNMLILYTSVTRDIPPNETLKQRLESYSKLCFNIGGFNFSLLDIEFGILRSHKEKPEHLSDKEVSSLIPSFSSSDPRLPYVIATKDPRLTFALYLGTASSPPIHIYHPEKIFDELDEITRLYIQNNVIIDPQEKKILLPKILEWYSKDFGKTQEKMLKSLLNYMNTEQKSAVSNSFVIQFQPYDWTYNYSFNFLIENRKAD